MTTPRLHRALAPLLGLLALGLCLALPVERFFSDSQYLLGRVEAGAPPYYNIAYVPLGRLVAGLFGGWLGVERALELLSALCVAGAVAGTARLAARLGLGALGQAGAGLLLLLAPGVLFFGGVIEVHAVQLLGAVLALHLAVRARVARGGRAWALVALAGLLALVAHLSHVLLLPGLLLLAWGRAGDTPVAGGLLARPGDGRLGLGLGLAGVPWLLALLLLGGAGAGLLLAADFDAWSSHPGLQWLATLAVFGERFLGSLGERGFFAPAEVFGYLRVELLGALGVLVLGFPVGLAAWLGLLPKGGLADDATAAPADDRRRPARRFAARGLLVGLPALLLLPQGGVLERGGYFLTLAPILAVQLGLALDLASAAALARAGRPGPGRSVVRLVVLLLALGQALLALEARASFRAAGPDARDWAREVGAELTDGDSVLVSSLARTFALAAERPGVHVRDLARDLDLEPDRGRSDKLGRVLAERLTAAAYPGDLWLDGALLPDYDPARAPAGAAPAWQRELHRLLGESPVPVELLGTPAHRLICVRRR